MNVRQLASCGRNSLANVVLPAPFGPDMIMMVGSEFMSPALIQSCTFFALGLGSGAVGGEDLLDGRE
jgi:hypothetical protein